MSNPFTVYAATQTVIANGKITAIDTGLEFTEDHEFHIKASAMDDLPVIATQKRANRLFIVVGNTSDTDIIMQQGGPVATLEVVARLEPEHVRFVETTAEGKRLTTCGSPAQIDTTSTHEKGSTVDPTL